MAMPNEEPRKPVDTEAMRKLIAKVKRGDEDNATAIATEISDREGADAEIITSLEDETTARRLNDELLEQQIAEVAVQTDWNENDSQSLAYLKNHPLAISNLEIEALFI